MKEYKVSYRGEESEQIKAKTPDGAYQIFVKLQFHRREAVMLSTTAIRVIDPQQTSGSEMKIYQPPHEIKEEEETSSNTPIKEEEETSSNTPQSDGMSKSWREGKPTDRSFMINKEDKRPYCPNCQEHVSPQVVTSSKNTGPTMLVDTPGPVDFVAHTSVETQTMFCSYCGSNVHKVLYCSSCNDHVLAVKEYHRTSGWSWGKSPMEFCSKCKKQLSGPEKSELKLSETVDRASEVAEVGLEKIFFNKKTILVLVLVCVFIAAKEYLEYQDRTRRAEEAEIQKEKNLQEGWNPSHPNWPK